MGNFDERLREQRELLSRLQRPNFTVQTQQERTADAKTHFFARDSFRGRKKARGRGANMGDEG